jgi:hypothetical protein
MLNAVVVDAHRRQRRRPRLRRESMAVVQRWRDVGKVGLGALIAASVIAVPETAFAASQPKPIAGAWVGAPQDGSISGSIVVTSGRDVVKSLTFVVGNDAIPAGCPTGTVTIRGPLALKYYTFAGTRPFWAFGKVALVGTSHTKRFQETRVSDATLDGKPDPNIAIELEFDSGSPQNDRIAGGVLDLQANKIKPAYGASTCGGSLAELQPNSPTS